VIDVTTASYRRGALLALTALALVSCVGPGIQRQVDVVRVDIDKARKSGAYQCAPRELALAESHADFTENELEQGNFMRAQEHVVVAVDNIKLALANSKDCGPKRVLIKKNLDRDLDGILDEDDNCPDEPGPARPEHPRFHGCPDNDMDGDGVLDHLDRCPKTPGPVENQGCPLADRDGDGVPDVEDQCPDEPGPARPEHPRYHGCPDADTDGDGVFDHVDKCPETPGPVENAGCPYGDRDGDGLPDNIDDCPDVPGPIETRGCPDRDGDRIADKDDKCPDDPGEPSPPNPADRHGCPILDSDGDGIPDHEDKCPMEVGVAQPDDPERHGCPKQYKLIVIKKDKIEIRQQVKFDTGKATIRAESASLLAEVADAVKNSTLKLVRIEGHTDSVGNRAYNQRLSEERADSVRSWLIDKEGIDPDMLEARGFGMDMPIASNNTKLGRQQNRRVEFNVDR
jgi:OmpA-OmpF porin, OOP family